MTPVGLGVRVPDVTETLARVEGIRGSRLAQLVNAQQMQEREALSGALAQHGGALFGGDPAAQQTALEALVRGGGPGAVPLAAQFYGQMRQPNPTRERNVGAQVVTEEFDPASRTWRPIGTAPRWQPQQATPETFGAPVPLQNPRTGQVELVQVGNRGTVRPMQGYAPPPQPTDPKDESAVRKEFQQLPAVRQFNEVDSQYRAIQDAIPRDTAAADYNIVIAYAKMLDPTSVVREGEQESIRRTDGVFGQLQGWLRGLSGGGRLRPDVRESIRAEAEGRHTIARNAYDATSHFYSGLARQYGFDPARVVQPREAPASRETPRPAGFDSRLPDAPRDPAQRQSGTIYNTPSGPFRWNGSAWEPAS